LWTSEKNPKFLDANTPPCYLLRAFLATLIYLSAVFFVGSAT